MGIKETREGPSPDSHQSLLFPEIKHEYTISFASKGEYACGILLEKYIPDFILIPGATFQVPVSTYRKCDFRVHDTFIEYHPVTFHHDFDDKQALRRFNSALKRIDDISLKREIKHAIKAELGEKYYLKRWHLVREAYGDSVDLSVAFDAKTLYDLVITRYGENYPNSSDFESEFLSVASSV